jgi:4-amino-4-deoxy-L-arabinose transferase-like glycosyltransferase
MRSALAAAVVLVVGGASMLVRLGATEVCGFNEGVEALVIQQMVDHGRWLFPLMNGHEPPFKPPLFHWAAAALAYLLGIHAASELTVRLPSIAFALVGIAVTMAFTHRRLGAHAAMLAGLILIGSHQYMSEARVGRVDMTLTVCETLLLVGFLGWQSDVGAHPRTGWRQWPSRWHWVMALTAGLAVLAKGPVGALLPVVAITVTLGLERRWSLVSRLVAPGPAIVFLAVSCGWYAACLLGAQGATLSRQIISENLARLTGGLGAMPWWYYLKPVLLDSFPLSLLIPIAVVAGLRRAPVWSRRSWRRSSRGYDVPLLLATFWVVTVVFFTIAAYKRRAYLLPLSPAAAMLIVWWVTGMAAERRGQVLRGALSGVCGSLVLLNAVYIPAAEARERGQCRYRAAAATINHVVPTDQPLYFADGVVDDNEVPLLFYLDRTVPVWSGALADAPLGYLLVPASSRDGPLRQDNSMHEALTVGVESGKPLLTLLRHDADVATR